MPRSLEGLRAPLLAAVRRTAPAWLRDEAEDLTQVAMTRLDRALRAAPDRELTRAYLGRIAYTTVVDEIRRRRKEREHAAELTDVSRQAAAGPGPEAQVAGAEAGIAITACLEEAAPRTRDALTLYLLGHTVPEIAHLSDLGRKVAENIVYRGLAALRRCLAGRGFAR